jgi:cell division protease FtsH
MDEDASDTGLWVAVLAFLILMPCLLLALLLGDPAPALPEIGLNDLAESIKAGQISSVILHTRRGEAWTSDDTVLQFRIDGRTDLLHTLGAYGVTADELRHIRFEVAEPPAAEAWLWRIGVWLPPTIMGLALVLLMRQSQPREILQFGRRPVRAYASTATRRTSFADVAGMDEAKGELIEVVEFLKDPEKFTALGARVPKGVLLIGPPGTGKTLLARAVAGEAHVPFLSISGSEFVEIVVGVGASRVRDLFAEARDRAPGIVFVDEIDAVARQRGAGLGPADDEREQTLNQVLVEMDGFEPNTNIVVIAATNRPDVLDPALLRPGRFDRRVVLAPPDASGRQAILSVHAAGKPLEAGVDLSVIARATPSFTGADLANLMNESAILAARRGKRKIGVAELEEAIERVLGGPARDSSALSRQTRLVHAYREAGHAVVMHHLPEHDPVHKVSIVRRGLSCGSTRVLPEVERAYLTKPRLEAMLTACLGGMAAEHLLLGETTSSAQQDLATATGLARDMVEKYGMSEQLGPVALDSSHRSDHSAVAIDEEIQLALARAHQQAMGILEAHREALTRLADALLESETISGDALAALL